MKGILLVATLLFAQSAFAMDEATRSEAQVLELARQATLRYCQDHEAVFGGYYKTRCEFIGTQTTEGWLVSGHPIYENNHGEQSIVEGGDVVLHYSTAGKLLRHEGAAF